MHTVTNILLVKRSDVEENSDELWLAMYCYGSKLDIMNVQMTVHISESIHRFRVLDASDWFPCSFGATMTEAITKLEEKISKPYSTSHKFYNCVTTIIKFFRFVDKNTFKSWMNWGEFDHTAFKVVFMNMLSEYKL